MYNLPPVNVSELRKRHTKQTDMVAIILYTSLVCLDLVWLMLHTVQRPTVLIYTVVATATEVPHAACIFDFVYINKLNCDSLPPHPTATPTQSPPAPTPKVMEFLVPPGVSAGDEVQVNARRFCQLCRLRRPERCPDCWRADQ